MCDEVLFKLRYPNGKWIIIYTDGRVDGVPPGTIIINRHPVILNSLLARLELERLETGSQPHQR
jgi:hypothetical protein